MFLQRLPKTFSTNKQSIVAGGVNASRHDAAMTPYLLSPLHPAPPLHDAVGVDKVKLNAYSTRELRVLLLPVACHYHVQEQTAEADNVAAISMGEKSRVNRLLLLYHSTH